MHNILAIMHMLFFHPDQESHSYPQYPPAPSHVPGSTSYPVSHDDFMSASHDLMVEMSHRQHQHDHRPKAQSMLSENGSQVQTQDPILLALLAKKRSSQRHASHQPHGEGARRGDRTGGGMSRNPPSMPDKKAEDKIRMRETLHHPSHLQQPAHPSSDYTQPRPGSKPRALFKPRSSQVQEVNLPQAEQMHPLKVSMPSGREAGGTQREQSFNSSAKNPVKKPHGDRERVVSSTLPHSHSPQQEKKYAHHMVKSWIKQQKRRCVLCMHLMGTVQQ